MEDIIKDNRDRLIETLQNTVDAENMLHFCLGHLASLIKHGTTKRKINNLSEVAKTKKELLIQRLKDLGVSKYLPEEHCRFCHLKAESFSLLGTINLGLEIIDVQIKLYKDLLKFTTDMQERKELRQILDTKSRQKTLLKNERKFVSKEEHRLNFIDSYCIPDIVSKLWK